MLRVLIVDGHHLFREGLVHVLGDMPDIRVVGSASDGEAALRQALESQPDAILIDPWMPMVGGAAVLERLREDCPGSRLLVLTVSEADDELLLALRCGVQAYLLKSVTSQELLAAIQQVCAGGVALTPTMTARLAAEYVQLAERFQLAEVSTGESLTGREREILRWVADGCTNKEIGAELKLSPHTVKAHLRSILDKLGLRRRAEAAAWAVQHGIDRMD
jgi:two-component system, NarL family, nitrate/nitrite response regulator NarL